MPPSRSRILIAAVVAAGFALRLREALTTYLNPDEVLLALSGQSHQIGFTFATADHPPLLGFLLGLIATVQSSPIALRLPAVIAGALVPWVVYRWLADAWHPRAAMVAMVILAFAPNLVSLGAQARGYSLLLLLCALAISQLDRALRSNSWAHLLAFTCALYLAIVTEYSAAWFVGAVGVYAMLQMARRPRAFVALWLLGQMGAVALYAWLLHAAPAIDGAEKAAWISGFLRGAFPAPGEHIPVFAAIATLKQFAYLFGSIPIGVVALLLFAAGLAVIWRHSALEPGPPRIALLALLVTPFLLGIAGAVLGLHPYGRSRHTVILSLFIATGVGIAVGALPWSKRRWSALAGMAALVAWWNVAEPDQNNIGRARDLTRSLDQAMAFLHEATPSGAIVTDGETAAMLRYYTTGLAPLQETTDDGLTTARMGDLRVGWRQWMFADAAALDTDVHDVRQRLQLSPQAPVWIVDGGFDIQLASLVRKRSGAAALRDFRSFDDALMVFRAPDPVAPPP